MRRSVVKPLRPFWREKPLSRLTRREWERLCDRCGRCCVVKERDARTGRVRYTDEACPHVDAGRGRCRCYRDRRARVPDCLDLYPLRCAPKELAWLPSHCAYRLLAEGRDLPAWHPLVTGRRHSVRDAGMSMQDRCRSSGARGVRRERGAAGSG